MPKTAEELLAKARRHIDRLTPEQTLEAMHAGAVLVDTRTESDRRNEGTIAGAVAVADSVLEWRADPADDAADPRLTTGARLIVMCNDGYSSSFKADHLRKLGHRHPADVIGGYRAWKLLGLPVEEYRADHEPGH